MRHPRLLRPILTPASSWLLPFISTVTAWPVLTIHRACSCSAPLSKTAKGTLRAKPEQVVPPDHRTIGTAQSLFTTHVWSPGVPLFLPNGTHIFQKLMAFIRAQYPAFGFREVLTPTIYKQSCWEKSGHWNNYKDDMFTVTATRREPQLQPGTSINGSVQPRKTSTSIAAPEEFGLKPMNCPGHCILFQSERRSYKDLPIRYADFSPLHRNEISGALSGLTRVRRFHQDDGHIFCRPNQVKAEISKSLDFIKLVHQTLNLSDYRLVLSTRPKDNYIGTLAEWDRAEDQLKQALDDTGAKWRTQQGDGAFYGPKIDVILNDSDGKEHQTATIQLDFQLPKRFELVYDAPAPEMEALGTPDKDPKLRRYKGKVTPVMIHRAALGSIERFMALLLERHKGRLPFWLSPKQVIILTVTDHAPVIEYARNLEKFLSTAGEDRLPKQLHRPTYIVHVDDSGDTLNRKFVRAKQEMYNMICVVGNRNMKAQDEPNNMYSGTVDVDINAQPDQLKTWTAIEKIKPGSQAPIKKDRGVGSKLKGYPVVRLTGKQCRRLIEVLDNNYL